MKCPEYDLDSKDIKANYVSAELSDLAFPFLVDSVLTNPIKNSTPFTAYGDFNEQLAQTSPCSVFVVDGCGPYPKSG
jgi:hypothetical protein